MKMFASDNCSGVHPKVMKAIVEANNGHAFPYGNDPISAEVKAMFHQAFGLEVDVYFVANGTGANVIGLSSMLQSYEGVICTTAAHINTDECGAFERVTGSKLIQVPHYSGKINIEDIKDKLILKAGLHHAQPKVISVTQTTEFGTVYSCEELKELADFAHERGLLLHVDGARVSNGLAAMNCNVEAMFTKTGVDMLSFGGTKNGMMVGEAIIAITEAGRKHLPFLQKQSMQLISKQRYIAAQFKAMLEDDLYLQNARHANKMAKLLSDELVKINGITLNSPVESNMVFAHIPKEWIEKLQAINYFYLIDAPSNLVRFVTSFDTKEEEVFSFIQRIKDTI